MENPFYWSVSAAVAVFDGDSVLLQQRRDTGAWELPGGCLEPGETPWQAARRECVEETGVRPRNMALSGVYTRCDVPVTELVFAATVLDGTTQSSEEAVTSRFVPVDQALYMVDPIFNRKIQAAHLSTSMPSPLPIDHAQHDADRWLS